MSITPATPVRAEHTGPSLRTVVGALLWSNRVLLPILLAVITAGALLRLAFDQSFGFSGDPRSVWEGTGAILRWFLLVVAVCIPVLQLPVLVAHGVTRRRVADATAVLLPLVAVAGAAVMAVGFLVEHAVADAAGQARSVAESHLFDEPTQVHLVLAEYTLVLAAWMVTGWLIGLGYYRFGLHWGTLALPAAVLPMLATEYLFGTALGIGLDPISAAGPLGVRLAAALAVTVAGVAAARALGRGAALHAYRG